MRFDRNPNLHAELRAQPQFVAGVSAIAVQVAASIREVAPLKTGHYRRSIRPTGTQVKVTDAFWHLVEFGSIHNPPYAPVRRGVRAAGLRLDETPK